jgi:hypothetical protein
MVVWCRRGGAPWTRWWSLASSLHDLGGSGSIWARAGLDGLGWARMPTSAEPPGGGGDGLAVPGTAVWLVCCSRAAGALWACLGLARPVWASCAPAALFGRRLPSGGGGGGFLTHGWNYCPCLRRCCVSLSFRPHAIVHEETVMVTTRPWWRVLEGSEAWWWCSDVPGFFWAWVGRNLCPLIQHGRGAAISRTIPS